MIKNFYSYLFYCYYNTVLKRENDTSYERANALLSISASFLLFSSYTFLNILMERKYFNPTFEFIATILLFLTNWYIHKVYFIDSRRYKDIIEKYTPYNKKYKTLNASIAIFLIVLGFAVLVASGICLSKYLRTNNLFIVNLS